MRAIFSFIIILILGTIAQLFLPWWTIAIVCFAVGLAINKSGWGAFFAGFLAVLALWLGYALGISIGNGFILSSRIAELFTLPHSSLLFLLTGLIGGLVGGLSTLSGFYLQTINQKTKTRKNKYV